VKEDTTVIGCNKGNSDWA